MSGESNRRLITSDQASTRADERSRAMSGALHPPLIAHDQASKLLDEVIYERVMSFIDLEGLFLFEQELWSAFDEAGCADDGDVPMRVKELIDRALMRFCDDPRRYLDFCGPTSAGSFDDCELCEQEAKQAAKRGKTG
jgi:hypothetical protein